jgi:hypothetical protein
MGAGSTYLTTVMSATSVSMRSGESRDRVRTILLVDFLLHVEVDAGDDDVGGDVERAHAVENVRVVKRYLLGDLHERPTQRVSTRFPLSAGAG